jgi:hypothetical protein
MNEETAPDIFEKLFGKPPESGYEYNYLKFHLGWRAVIIQWGCKGVGFGELVFIFDPERGLQIDHECMGREFTLFTIDEAVRRIENGQKLEVAKRGLSDLQFEYTESVEENEEFIKNMLLTFRYYIVSNKIDFFND